MHIGATVDSVGFGQCPAPSRVLSLSCARESVSKQSPAPTRALSRSRWRRWHTHHTWPDRADSPSHVVCKDLGCGTFQGKTDVRAHQFLASLLPSLVPSQFKHLHFWGVISMSISRNLNLFCVLTILSVCDHSHCMRPLVS